MSNDDAARRAGRTLVLGIGNEIVTDDGVGIHVARRVHELLSPALRDVVDVDEACTGGFDLVDYLAGYARAVIADAIKTEGGAPGAVYDFDADALRPTAHLAHVHGVNLAGALAIADQLRLPVPREVRVVAVEADEIYAFGEKLTPAVAAAVDAAAERVLSILKEWHLPTRQR